MRIYFDYDEEEDSDLVDIQLTEMEIKRLLSFELIEKNLGDPLDTDRNMNICIRRSNYASKKR